MAQIINTNIASLNAQRNLNSSQNDYNTALERLSSGLRINSAKDDAAGLAISTRFESQITGLDQAIRNAGDGVSLAQTAEGALDSMTDNLQRIRELAVQSSNATNSDDDRVALQAEVEQLLAEVTRTAEETTFNGQTLLDGSFDGIFQIGADAGQTVSVSISELTASKLGSDSQSGVSAVGVDAALENNDLVINGVSVGASSASDDTASTASAASSAIAKVAAINEVSDETGVTAMVNDNYVAGTEMTAAELTGTITLNGVTIDIQTSDDASTSRASVAQAINAVADQTGVTAVDTGNDFEGVALVAEDGRNIDITFDTVTAAATGLAAQDTYVGGYTLVADAGTDEIVVEGGNGTGNGDIANSGLAAGTYDAAVAYNTSSAIETTTTNGALTGTEAAYNNVVAATTATTINQDYTATISIDGVETTDQIAAATTQQQAVAVVASTVNALSDDITAWEEIDGVLTDAAGANGDAITIAGQAFTLSGATAAERMEDLTDQINAADFGANIEVSASYDATGDSDGIALNIKNFTADGLDISVDADNDFTWDPTGATVGATNLLNAGSTVSGQVEYVSETGKDVSVSLSRDVDGGADLLMADTEFSSTGSTYSGPNVLEDGDLSINGVSISQANASDDTASAVVASDGSSAILSSSKEASAISIAAAINDVSDETGVSATVNATEVVGGDGTVDTDGFEAGDQAAIYINGVEVGTITLQNDTAGNLDADQAKSDAISAINATAGQTGVTAVDNGTSITLTAADGRNISVAIDNQSGATDSSTGIGAVFGLASSVDGIGESVFGDTTDGPISAEALTYETTSGTVTLESASEFTVDVATNGKDELQALGFEAGSYGGGEDGTFLEDIDISTFEGAQDAILAIDNALTTVTSQQAELGAIQNRFESTTANLEITQENLTAAQSAIQDADFAEESAELSRTSVLQQAGISVLAQANAATQNVLSLLG